MTFWLLQLQRNIAASKRIAVVGAGSVGIELAGISGFLSLFFFFALASAIVEANFYWFLGEIAGIFTGAEAKIITVARSPYLTCTE